MIMTGSSVGKDYTVKVSVSTIGSKWGLLPVVGVLLAIHLYCKSGVGGLFRFCPVCVCIALWCVLNH